MIFLEDPNSYRDQDEDQAVTKRLSRPWTKTWQAHGFKCLARINWMFPGTNRIPCGYVGLPLNHPDHGKNYDDIDVDAPGGLTFSGLWEDQNDSLWYVGFDLGHAWDMDPFDPGGLISTRSTDYLIEETEKLAEQLAERREKVQ